MDRFIVAVVIPAYNEEATIGQVVKSVIKYGDAIVVNDASTDYTELEAKHAGAIVVNHTLNKGYDHALSSGFEEADNRNYDAVITFDADGQHSSKMLEEYIQCLKGGKDLVLGVRPKPARIAEWIFMFYTRIKFNWKDPLCGMKGYSIRLYRERGYFDSSNSIGTGLAMYGLLNGYNFVQIPVPIKRRKGRPKFSGLLNAEKKIILALLGSIIISKNK